MPNSVSSTAIYYIAPPAFGLGDLVVVLPIVQNLIAAGAEVYLVLRSDEHLSLATRIPGLAGTVLEWQFDAARDVADHGIYIDMRDHELQRRYWWGSPEFASAYPGWTINDILSAICTDKGLGDAYLQLNKLRPLHFTVKSHVSEQVIFVPGSAVAAKQWSVHRWLEIRSLLASEGIRSAVVGEPARSQVVAELVASGCTWIETPDIAVALDVLSSCRAVVSVDTGLMHLAVHQGMPTVSLYRAQPVYVRKFPHVCSVISVDACETDCYNRERDCSHTHVRQAGQGFAPGNWECANAADCGDRTRVRCLDRITPERVFHALKQVAAKRNTYSVPV